MPSFSSHSEICSIVGLRSAAVLDTTVRSSFDPLLDRAFAGLPPALEGFFIASAAQAALGFGAGISMRICRATMVMQMTPTINIATT
jgi:hypothetical protein